MIIAQSWPWVSQIAVKKKNRNTHTFFSSSINVAVWFIIPSTLTVVSYVLIINVRKDLFLKGTFITEIT